MSIPFDSEVFIENQYREYYTGVNSLSHIYDIIKSLEFRIIWGSKKIRDNGLQIDVHPQWLFQLVVETFGHVWILIKIQ